MASKRVKLTGQDELHRNLIAMSRKFPEATKAALYQKAQEVAGVAVERTPKEHGDLRRSVYVAPPNPMAGRIRSEIGFGVNYALPVHERVEVYHPVGGPLFLRSAILDAAPGWAADLAKLIRTFEKRGVKLGHIPQKYQETYTQGRSSDKVRTK